MNQILQEYVDSRGLAMQIDPVAGIIRGVKILGLTSRNRRTYLPQALTDAVGLYEGAKVNVNHARGTPFAPRDYQDRLGAIRSVRFEAGEGLFGDLHFNPKHPLAEQLAWDAKNAPENVGLSHNVEARTSTKEGLTVVEAIAAVHSVDLVADPATTRGLFEEANPILGSAGFGADAFRWSALTIAELRERRADLVAELMADAKREAAALREQLDHAQVEAALLRRRQLIDQLLRQHGLPVSAQAAGDSLVNEAFVDSLFAASDEAKVRELIAERAALVRQARARGPRDLVSSAQPRSRDQLLAEHRNPVFTTDDFVRAIT